jgi:O-antigen/teichoic acid export membrane protein
LTGPSGDENPATGKPGLRRHAKGLSWSGVDQVLASLSNLVIALALARSGGAEALGIFTVAFAFYLMASGLLRALLSEPLLTIPVTQDGVPDQPERFGAATAVAYLIPASLIVIVIGLASGRIEIVIVGVVLPLVSMQDFFRYVYFRRGRPELAAVLDAAWVATSLVGWPLVTAQGQVSVGLAVWALGGALGVLLAAVISRVRPASLRDSLAWWWRDMRPLGGFLALAGLLSTFFSQITTIGLATILGVSDLGTLRGAQIVLGPIGLAVTGFNVYTLPRLSASRARQNTRVALLVSGGAALLAAASTVVLWLLTPLLVSLLYGENLDVPPVLVLALGIGVTLGALSTGPALMLMARRRGGPIALGRAAAGVIGVPVVLVTAANFGLVPAAWAGNIAPIVNLTVISVAWRRSSTELGARPEPEPPTAAR